jgi:hypothetical protein
MAIRALKRPLLAANGPRRLPAGIGRGIRLEIDFAHHTRLYAGLYEVELNSSLRRLCPPGTRCFDVGAHFGYDTLVLAKVSGTQVRSFECEPALAERMKRNLALNPQLAERISVSLAYVAAQSDPARRQVTLDDATLAEGSFVPGFVKIDVEGAEADVLRGSRGLLAEHRPALVIETHDPDVERECQEILGGHGYKPEVIDRRRWLRDHRPIAHNRWLVAAGAHAARPA